MFPEITRNDIFRLETGRLWLRWFHARDAEAVTRYASDPEVALKTAVIPHPYALSDAEAFIRRARAENGAGSSLHLALTLKRQPADVIGAISLHDAERYRGTGQLGFVLAREQWGYGYMTEAATAFVDLVFSITSLQEIASSALPDNAASLRVQEKIGFVVTGEKMTDWPARGGPLLCTTTLLKRGAARDVFGARRPKLASV